MEKKNESSEDRSGMKWMTQENDEKYIFKRKMKSFFFSLNSKSCYKNENCGAVAKKGKKKSNDPIYLNLHPLNIYED